jgi:hypothetical protein
MSPRRPLFALLSAVMLPPLALFAQLQSVGSRGPIAGIHDQTGRIALSDSIARAGPIPALSAVAPRYVVLGPAIADSSLRASIMRDDGAPMIVDSLAYQRKSGLKAFALSALIAGGGQLYAGETKKGVVLTVMEVGGVGMTAASTVVDGDASYGLAAYGIVAALGSWIYSMIDAPHAARRYNEKHARAQPVVGIEPGRAARLGVRVALGR